MSKNNNDKFIQKLYNESIKRKENDAICKMKISNETILRAEENSRLSVKISKLNTKNSKENKKLNLKILEIENKIKSIDITETETEPEPESVPELELEPEPESEQIFNSTYTIDVTASNSNNYTLNGNDLFGIVTGNDPSIIINSGDTIEFKVNAPGHPFYIKTVPGTGTANQVSGLSFNGTTSGTITLNIPAGTYYYQCSRHGSMVGTIVINP